MKRFSQQATQGSCAGEMVRPKGTGRRQKNDSELHMSEDEVRRFLQACKQDPGINGQRAYAMFAMNAHLGLRISELVSLTKDNFRDLDSNVVHVYRRKKRKKKRGFRSERDQSRDFMWVSHKEKKFLKRILSGLNDRGLLFPIGSRMAQYLFAHYLRAGGLRPILTPHALRRFIAVRIMLLGHGEAPVRVRLGHRKRTEDHYLSGPDAIISIMEKLEVIE